MNGRLLTLSIAQFTDARHWTWRLSNEAGATLVERPVDLSGPSIEESAVGNLDEFLRLRAAPDRREQDEQRLAREVGVWIAGVLGPIGDEIVRLDVPTVVRVVMPAEPPEARKLTQWPLGLAWLGDKPLAQQDISFVIELPSTSPGTEEADPADVLRVLAVFSMPTRESPLGVRQERIALQQLFDRLAINHAIELRVVQYGVTQESLARLLRDGEGWDLIHISSHGHSGQVVLEREDGSPDYVTASKLVESLRDARARLKWITLSSCESGAERLAETREWLELEGVREARRADEVDRLSATDDKRGPGVASAIIGDVDCAVVAMRYPVEDRFAAEFTARLYEAAIGQGNALPRALQYAVSDAITASKRGPLAMVTPMLFGRRAATLTLRAPAGSRPRRSIPTAPKPEPYFVGRSDVMAQASATLAHGSRYAGVLLAGMAGIGKTACAKELADLQLSVNRFEHCVWYKAPNVGVDVTDALARFALLWDQTSDDVKMVGVVGADAYTFDGMLENLTRMLERRAILLVLDNLESLVNEDGTWRDSRFERVVAAILSHAGLSRAVLTSRWPPAFSPTGDRAPRILQLSVNALTFDESMVLARQLPNLDRLLRGDKLTTVQERDRNRALVKRALGVVQGHPKLIQMAEAIASDPAVLEAQIDRATGTATGGVLDAFFDLGRSDRNEHDFIETLKDWTRGVTAALDDPSRHLFAFLCTLDEGDRRRSIADELWPTAWHWLEQPPPAPGIRPLLSRLAGVGLVEPRDLGDEVAYNIHPAVAEIGTGQIAPEIRSTIEAGLARIWKSRYQRAIGAEEAGTEVQGDKTVVNDALKAAVYLMRLNQWNEAADVIEDVRYRDESPAVNERLIAYMQTVTAGTSARYVRNFRIAASVLLNARRYDEARVLLEKAARHAKEDGLYSEASVALDEMFDMLHTLGRIDEADVCLQDMKACTAAAGLGPWSQLIDATWTLTLLHDRGRDAEVLKEFDRDLYPRMRALPEWKQQPSDPADSSTGRELLLDIARQAALALRQWDRALDLNAEAQRSQEQRGAPLLELAELRMNDAVPLVHLGRVDEAADVIADCRAQFEKDEAAKLIGVSFSALALLDAARGNLTAAVENASTALRFRYSEERPAPAACASAHLDLAAYLARSGTDLPSAAAHHYAASLIRLRILAGEDKTRLRTMLTDVAEHALLTAVPPPKDFPSVCDMVERTTGVQFRKLFNALPSQRVPTGKDAYHRLRVILADAGTSAAGA